MGSRHQLWAGLIMFLAGSLAEAAERRSITYDFVVAEARKLAAQEYRAPDIGLPPELLELNYDEYREIRFKREETLWRKDGLPWGLEFFHRGYLFRAPVEVYEFSQTHVQRVPFVASWYDYGPDSGLPADAWFPSQLDYAGVRLRFPLHQPTVFDEVAAFLGASYFRMLGRNQTYGISARGIAINTLSEEEFPRFTRFWLRRPDLESESILLYALLDGESVTGAFQFRLTPGDTLRAEVKTTIFLRREVERLGFAPFSSMFFFGKTTVRKPPDHRPEVHDSDGLLMAHSGDQYLWRPLTNEHRTKDTPFPVANLQGFGLMQRERSFFRYEDLEAQYERRPSVWVEPVGEWPAGRVHLIELLSRDEIMDNIVAFWEPDEHPAVGEPFTLEYILHWTLAHPTPLGKVVSTRVGKSINQAGQTTVVIDFADIPAGPDEETARPEPVLTLAPGVELVHQTLQPNEHVNGWRLALQLRPGSGPGPEHGTPPVETGTILEARLVIGNRPVTETWHYLWIPPES